MRSALAIRARAPHQLLSAPGPALGGGGPAECTGINSYAKMVRQYRDRLVAGHKTQQAPLLSALPGYCLLYTSDAADE